MTFVTLGNLRLVALLVWWSGAQLRFSSTPFSRVQALEFYRKLFVKNLHIGTNAVFLCTCAFGHWIL